MKRKRGQYFYACGTNGIPGNIEIDGKIYVLEKVLKHDFFAATSLYIAIMNEPGCPSKLILKQNRRQHFFGIPLVWLGQMLRNHELEILNRLSPLKQVPHPITKYGQTGFIYEYIEGYTLDESQELPEHFFDNLSDLLNRIHRQSVVYIDMNKRGNIIVGADEEPYIIDFQISLSFDPNPWLFTSLKKNIQQVLKDADIYHLFKHKRKLAPETLRPKEKTISRPNPLIELHRCLANPYRSLRRKILEFLKKQGLVHSDNASEHH